MLRSRYKLAASAAVPVEGDALTELHRRTVWLWRWLLFFGATIAASACLWWFAEHARDAYRVKLAVEQPRQAQALAQWNRVCNPAMVPHCHEINETRQSLVCIDGDVAIEHVLGKRDIAEHKCLHLYVNATKSIKNEALGAALTEACAHVPLLNRWCDCTFDQTVRERPFLWLLSDQIISNFNTVQFTCLLGFFVFCALVPGPLIAVWRAHAEGTVKENDKLLAYGGGEPVSSLNLGVRQQQQQQHADTFEGYGQKLE